MIENYVLMMFRVMFPGDQYLGNGICSDRFVLLPRLATRRGAARSNDSHFVLPGCSRGWLFGWWLASVPYIVLASFDAFHSVLAVVGEFHWHRRHRTVDQRCVFLFTKRSPLQPCACFVIVYGVDGLVIV